MKRKSETEHPDPTELRRSKRIKEEKEKEKPVRDFIKEDSKRKRKGKGKEVIDEDTPGTSELTTRKRAAEDQRENASKRRHLEEPDRYQPAPKESTRQRAAGSQGGKTTRQRYFARSDGHQPAPEGSTRQRPAESQEEKRSFNIAEVHTYLVQSGGELENMQKMLGDTNNTFEEVKQSLVTFNQELQYIMHRLWPVTREKQLIANVPPWFSSYVRVSPVDWHQKLPVQEQIIASAPSVDREKLQEWITNIKSLQRCIVPLVDFLLARHEVASKDPGDAGKVLSQFVERIKRSEDTRDKNGRLRLYQTILLQNQHELDRTKEDIKAIGDNINTNSGMSLLIDVTRRVSYSLRTMGCLIQREVPVLYQEASKSIDPDKKKKIMDSYDEKLKDNQGLLDNQSVVSIWEILPSVIEVLRDENTFYSKLAERATKVEKQDRVSTEVYQISMAGPSEPQEAKRDEKKSEEEKFLETKKNIEDMRKKLKELESRLDGVSQIEAKRLLAAMRIAANKESAHEFENLEGLHAASTEVLRILQREDIKAIQDLFRPYDPRQLEDSRIMEHPSPTENENNAFEVARENLRQSLRRQSKEEKFRETKKNIEDMEKKLKELESRLDGVSQSKSRGLLAAMRIAANKESVHEVENLEGLHAASTEVLRTLQGEDIKAIQDLFRPYDQKQLEDLEHPSPTENENNAFEVARENLRQFLRRQRKLEEQTPDMAEEVVKEINRENSRRFLEGQTPDKLQLDEAADYLAKIATADRGKAMFVFDVDQTLIQSGANWVMPGEWVKGVEILRELGHVVVLNTGRKIETIDKALDKAGTRGRDLKHSLEICGERGAIRRGPKTNGEEILTNKRSEKYVLIAEELIEDIKSAIDENQILNNYKERGLVPQEFPITVHTLGGTILGKTFDDVKSKVVEEASWNESINADETFSNICETIEGIVTEVLDKYPEFKSERRLGLEIQLNPEVTGLKLGKGDAMGQVYKDYGDVSSILAFGDGHIDIPMGQRSQELATLRKLLGIYLSQQQRDKRIDFFKGVLSQLQKRYGENLEEDEMKEMAKVLKISFMEKGNDRSLKEEEIQKIVKKLTEEEEERKRREKELKGEIKEINEEDIEAMATKKNTLNEALQSLNKSEVRNFAFIGVECPRQSEDLLALANIRVDGPSSAAKLVYTMASIMDKINKDTLETISE